MKVSLNENENKLIHVHGWVILRKPFLPIFTEFCLDYTYVELVKLNIKKIITNY